MALAGAPCLTELPVDKWLRIFGEAFVSDDCALTRLIPWRDLFSSTKARAQIAINTATAACTQRFRFMSHDRGSSDSNTARIS
jgi:hypothetical protein